MGKNSKVDVGSDELGRADPLGRVMHALAYCLQNCITLHTPQKILRRGRLPRLSRIGARGQMLLLLFLLATFEIDRVESAIVLSRLAAILPRLENWAMNRVNAM